MAEGLRPDSDYRPAAVKPLRGTLRRRSAPGAVAAPSALQHAQDRSLLLECRGPVERRVVGRAPAQTSQVAVLPGRDDRRVDVAVACNCCRVAQASGGDLDGARQLALLAPHRLGRLLGRERPERQYSACPGSKVLGGDVTARDGSQVVIDILRVDRTRLPGLVGVLEEPLSGQLLDGADEPSQPTVADIDLVRPAALAPKAEADRRAIDYCLAVT